MGGAVSKNRQFRLIDGQLVFAIYLEHILVACFLFLENFFWDQKLSHLKIGLTKMSRLFLEV